MLTLLISFSILMSSLSLAMRSPPTAPVLMIGQENATANELSSHQLFHQNDGKQQVRIYYFEPIQWCYKYQLVFQFD